MRRVLIFAIAAVAMSSLVGCGKTIDSGFSGVYYNWRTGTDTDNVLGEGFQWLAPYDKRYARVHGSQFTVPG